MTSSETEVLNDAFKSDIAEQMGRADQRRVAGDYHKAIEGFSAVLTKIAHHAPALFSRGYCRACVGDWYSADEDFRKGFDLDPGHVHVLGTVVRRRMMSARRQVAPRTFSRLLTVAELVEQKFASSVRSEVLRVLDLIESHPQFSVGVEQLQRAVITVSDKDGRFVTEEHFWAMDPRDLVIIADAQALRELEGASFIQSYRASLQEHLDR